MINEYLPYDLNSVGFGFINNPDFLHLIMLSKEPLVDYNKLEVLCR